jgi:hypothetical protein
MVSYRKTVPGEKVILYEKCYKTNGLFYMKNLIRNRFHLALFVVLFVLFNACEYDTTEVYHRKVNQNVVAPEIQTIELNLEKDTIYVYTEMKINFQFRSNNQKIKTVRFLIDGVEADTVNSDKGVFILQYPFLKNGIHNLTIQIITATGSGSLAECIGAEGFVSTKTWILIVNTNYASECKASIENGLLKIRWAKYLAHDFKEYVIVEEKGCCTKTEIARLKSQEFSDTTYVGEGKTYGIQVQTLNGNKINWGRADVEEDLPKTYFVPLETNQYYLKCSKTKFYNAVDTFLISYELNSDNYVKATKDPNDTTFLITEALFGDYIYSKLVLVPKRLSYHHSHTSVETYQYRFYGYLGCPLTNPQEDIDDFHQINKDEFIYTSNCQYLVKYSISQKSTVERFRYENTDCSGCRFSYLECSPSGKFLTFEGIIGCDFVSMMLKSDDQDKFNLSNLSQMSISAWSILISDVGTGIVNNSPSGFTIYNLNTSDSLASYARSIRLEGKGMQFSPNGDYIFYKDNLLSLIHFENLKFEIVWSHALNAETKFYQFNASKNDQVVFWNGTTLSVKQCPDLSVIREFALTDSVIINIDYFNNEMLTYNKGHLFVKSFLDGSLIKDIPIHIDASYWGQACYLINHTIVNVNGIVYFVN